MVAQIAEPITPAPREYLERRDMPAGLTDAERSAYVRGYSRGCLTYVRKYGSPGVAHDDATGPAPTAGTAARRALGVQLTVLARAHEEERHPSAHKAGLAALRKYRKSHGIPEPVAPRAVRAPRARKVAAPAPVVDAVATVAEDTPAAPVLHVVPAANETIGANRTRRLARRALAAAMRERGEDPRDASAWEAAKIAAGVK